MNTLKGFAAAVLVLALAGAGVAQDRGHQQPRGQGNHHPEQGEHGRGQERHQGQEDGECKDGQEPSAERPPIGEVVKDITLTDNAGKTFQLSAFRRGDDKHGSITVLTFWCTTCHSCRTIDHDFEKLAAAYRPKGVQVLTVASNEGETAKGVNGFLKKTKLTFPVLLDSESQMARYFAASVTTTTVIIDAEGKLRYYGGFAHAEDALEQLLAGEEVATPETELSGCPILHKPLEGEKPESKPGEGRRRH